MTVLICWLAVSIILTSIICRAIHNTKAQERAGINARFEA
jgi:hypothetical protein